jgi:YVTN family beta-propeller protein
MRFVLLLFLGCLMATAQPSDSYEPGKHSAVNAPVRAVTDPGVVTTRQAITPAGVPTVFNGRVYGVAFGASASELWVLNATDVFRLDWKNNKILDRILLSASPGLQSLQWDAVAGRALVGALARGSGVQLLGFSEGRRTALTSDLGTFLTGALAVAPTKSPTGERRAVLPLTANNKLAIIDADTGKALGHAETGIAPFGSVISQDGTIAYVTNWGGRLPKTGDLTAPTGLAARADKVVVDKRGIASSGTVTRIDLTTRAATHTIAVELHPTAILWDEPRARLYVANGNKDSVSVIDTKSQRVVRTIAIQPFSQTVMGIAPTALAISPDGAKIYVACGGINAVVVVDVESSKIDGMIPTAWYPNSLAISADGKRLAVSSLLGAGSAWRETPNKRFVHANRGSVSVVDFPDSSQLASYSTVVAENNHMQLRSAAPMPAQASRGAVKAQAIPARSGDPTPIEHVVYIIKENRTYDQVFGDLPQANGDPSLVMFGRDVTPNQHKLAEEFVILDNFYATGGNSADGHQWVTQANETAYCMWPGYAGRSYPFDGTDPIAYASGGFLWDYALARNKSVRIYGEYVGRLPVPTSQRRVLLDRWAKGDDFSREWTVEAPIAPLNKIMARNYPSYTTSIPDVIRAQLFLSEFRKMDADGKMPNLTLIQLPSNHTNGASPDVSSAKAMVADNDLALGQIIQALTRSKFWPKMAIFVVEDDAQNGVDHVDGHRTTALAISPYTKRGSVDSTFYSTQSMVKTIELILGLPTMSLFDLIAHDMRNSFTDAPDLTPYEVEQPKQSLFERNPPVNALRGPARQAALASLKMRFDVPDAAPTEKLNRILWGQIRGWSVPYPGAKSAVFSPLSLDIDDDDR